MPESLLFQFRHGGPGEPTLREVSERFGFDETELDGSYGVVKVSDDGDDDALYTVRVDAASRARFEQQPREELRGGAEGFFSNPRIEPFGPPEP